MRELVALGAAPLAGGASVAVASERYRWLRASASSARTHRGRGQGAQPPRRRPSPGPSSWPAWRFVAEHDHVGVRCGIMDQMSAALARPGRALAARSGASLAVRHIPIGGRCCSWTRGCDASSPRARSTGAAGRSVKPRSPASSWSCRSSVGSRAGLRPGCRASSARYPSRFRSRALHVVGETARARFGAQLLAAGT